jgi:predicted nucleotidyltransferase
VRDDIQQALRTVEQECGVRVLYAVESGSRAWGFASPDSDYDVRFVYVHELDWYLRLAAGPDHLERMLPGDLDVVGWELRKALGLFAGANASLFEHLGSPIVYRDEGGLLSGLRALVPTFFNPIAAANHYLGLARNVHDSCLAAPQVNLKKLFYVLRPLACLRWIELRDSMPPTEFHAVLDGIDLTVAQRGWITDLTAQKAGVGEAHGAPLAANLRDWLGAWLQQGKAAAAALPHRSGDRAVLDRVLARCVRAGGS